MWYSPREVVGPPVGAALEELGVRAHGGERRAELVRGIGDESAQAQVGGLDPVEHRVEHEAEPPSVTSKQRHKRTSYRRAPRVARQASMSC